MVKMYPQWAADFDEKENKKAELQQEKSRGKRKRSTTSRQEPEDREVSYGET
jgi:hypothetical protein